MVDPRRRPGARVTRRARPASWAIAAVLVAAWTVSLPAPAAAASLTLDPTSGVQGAEVNAIGSGFPTDARISVLWDGEVLKSARTGSAETFVIGLRVPAEATVGPHTVTLCVTSTDPASCTTDRADATFSVVARATPEPSPTEEPTPTPAPVAASAETTPADVLPFLIAALVLGTAGTALAFVRKRRFAAAARRAAQPGAWRGRRAS